jgi:Cu/Ag efflux protein CusF
MLQNKARMAIGLALLIAGAMPAIAETSGAEWLQKIQEIQGARANPSDGVWVSVKVINVDQAGRLLTISHGGVPSAGMPAMSMTFPVEDSPHLAMLRAGEAIDIQVANRDGVVKITGFRMNH